MQDKMMQILSGMDSEKDYEGIIQLTLPVLLEHPDDIKARYCLAMAYISKGDRTNGLKQLQNIVSQSSGSNKNDRSHRLFLNQVILQTVEITELSLHGGDILGEKTLRMVKDVNEYGHKSGVKDLERRSEEILKRWIHINSTGQAIVALIPDSPLTLQVEPTNVCNLNCTMCPRSKMTRKPGFMDPAVFDKMLDG